MNSEDKFRELLNEKLEGKEFPFNAGNWEKAQEMIDASRGRKKRRAIILWLFLIGTLGISTYLVWNRMPEDSSLAATDSPAVQVSPDAGIAKTGVAPQQAAGNRSAAPVAGKTNMAPAAEAAPEAPEGSEKTKPAAPATLPGRSGPAAAEKIKTPANLPAGSKPAETTRPAAQTAAPMAAAAKPAGQTPARQLPVPPAVAAMPEKDPAAEQKNPDAQTPASDAGTPADKAGQPIETAKAAPGTTTAVTPEPAQEQTEPNAMATAGLAADSLAQPPAAAKDTAGVAADATEVMIRKPSYPKHLFFAEAGANYLAGWPAPQQRDAAGFNPIAGIGYINNLTENLGLSLGMGYTSIGHLGAYSHTSTVNTLGLGEQSAVTVITPARLHYLALPLRLTMAIDSRNSFGLGYTLAYLLTADSKVETYDQVTNSEVGGHIRSNYAVSSARGYVQGFSAFDSQLSVLYRRRLYRELFVNTELQLGLTDLKDNKFFASNSFERSLGLKVTLMYNIFKK